MQSMEDRKKLPVGVSNYPEICERNYYYVDKTLLIKELVDHACKGTLFARSRRFGKTLNMNMLRTFFEMSDENTAQYFEDKRIWKCRPKYTNLQGKYPVIYLSFVGVNSADWETAQEKLMDRVLEECSRLIDGIDVSRLSYMNRIRANDMLRGTMSAVDREDSLLNLTAIVHEYYAVKPVVLIDEYDTPIVAAWDHGYYDRMKGFLNPFLTGALKDNGHLSFACMSGVLQVTGAGICGGLNHLDISNVLSKAYDAFFGFTSEEVQAMTEYYGVPENYDQIRAWYEGYRFGEQVVFNPWAIINYFQSGCEAEPYWVSTSRNDVIGNVLDRANGKVAEGFRKALDDGSVWSSIDLVHVCVPGHRLCAEGTNGRRCLQPAAHGGIPDYNR